MSADEAIDQAIQALVERLPDADLPEIWKITDQIEVLAALRSARSTT